MPSENMNNTLTFTSDMGDASGLFGLIAVLGVFALVFAFIGFIFYVLQAIGLYKIATKQGYDKPWLAWIPFVNIFMIPILVEDEVHESIRGKFTMIFGISFAASVVLGFFLPFLSFIPTILTYYGFYLIAVRYSEQPVVHLVIAVLTLGLTMPFQLLRFGSKEPLA